MAKFILFLGIVILLFGFTLNTSNRTNNGTFTVVIDPGHGGDDYGATHQEVSEKEITLSIAKKIKQFSNPSDFNIIFTRNNDQFKSLKQRMEYSKTTSPSLFISLHVNESQSNSSGTEIYYSENSKYQVISETFSNTLRQTFEESQVHLEVVKTAPANFYVLKESNCPSVLIELGFIDNQDDKAYLGTPHYQDKIAKSIVTSILKMKDS
jgi:N-acetylmuramoyl-L-alanine amidase